MCPMQLENHLVELSSILSNMFLLVLIICGVVQMWNFFIAFPYTKVVYFW